MRSFLTPLLTLLALLFGASPASVAAEEHRAAGHVYVLNNDLVGPNSITVFARAADGTLTRQGVTAIGGTGSVLAFADGTQGSLIRTPDGSRLFAVDAGSDEISVIDAENGHLSPVGVFKSGGSGPVSLTFQGGLLYVLNAANANPAVAANVTGFRVGDDGHLSPIAGSTRALSAPHPNPAEVLLSPDGRQLLVSAKGTNLIDIYRVGDDGSLRSPTSVRSIGDIPFGMAFVPGDDDHRRELVVSDAAGGPNFTGAATAYRLLTADLRLINGPVPDHQIAPCWMVVTRNGRFAYTSNADSFSISGYRIGNDGVISLLNPSDGVTATTPRDTFPIEESLSRNSRFLYVLDSRLLLPAGPGPATLSGFRIEADGRLTPVIDPASFSLPFSAIGQAAD